MNSADLQLMRTTLERAFELGLDGEGIDPGEVRSAAQALIQALESGAIRVAEPQGYRWSFNIWVKKGLILSMGLEGIEVTGRGIFKHDGSDVTPLSRVNVGAYIDEGVVVGPDVLIGACTQLGKRVYLSAAVKLGGMLEPVEAPPVIVEDDVFIGGGCGVYEGTVIHRRAVLAAGAVLTGSTPVYDAVKGDILRPASDRRLEIPEGAVVVPGTRRLDGEWGAVHGLSLQSHIIVGYRDEGVDAHTALKKGLA